MANTGNRGHGAQLPHGGEKLGLPLRPILWPIDVIATFLSLDEQTIIRSYVFFEGRSTGVRHRDLMTARNIAPASEKPEWRIAERELIRWMKVKGFRFYERTVLTN